MKAMASCTRCGIELTTQSEAGLGPQCRGETMALAAALGRGGGSPAPSRSDAQGWEGLTSLNRFAEYESLEKIARGGMGVVYRAWHRKQGRLVALKVLAGGAEALDPFRARFVQEVKALGALDHPNIVPLYDEGEFEGNLYYSMRLIRGQSLAELLRAKAGPFSVALAAALIAKVARAVHHAHERGVLHRDLKPSNILIETANGEPQVIDFGVAKLAFVSQEITLTDSLLGT